jgi:hypothetical protein
LLARGDPFGGRLDDLSDLALEGTDRQATKLALVPTEDLSDRYPGEQIAGDLIAEADYRDSSSPPGRPFRFARAFLHDVGDL